MRKKFILSMLIITALAITFGFKEAKAGFPAPPRLPAPPGLPAPAGLPGFPNVNVSVSGYLPAPPGVYIQIDAGRPYYVERGRRIYLKKAGHARYHGKHGHYKHKWHGH
jgi:hypothetical protein